VIKGLSILVAIVFVLTAPTPPQSELGSRAFAQGVSPDVLLKRAEKLYEQLEYAAALRLLFTLQRRKDAKPIHRARAFLYMGVCFTALGKAENAVLAFIEVLKIRPRFRLPAGVSPSIRAMFAAALKRTKLPTKPPPKAATPNKPKAPPPGSINLDAEAKPTATAGTPIPLTIKLKDKRGLVDQLVVFWRRHGGGDFSKIKLSGRFAKPGKHKAQISAATLGTKKGRLYFYVEARDRGGRPVARSGNEDEPHEVELIAGAEGSSNWAWWTLGIVGGAAAVAGGVVAAILLTKSGSNGPGSSNVVVVIK
jgi:hypothetical protein